MMRRPIRTQMLVAMLLVVAFGIALATATGIYLAVLAAERREESQLAGVKKIISEATFPLTESVLRQMHDLSGAEFVLLDKNGRNIRGTIALDNLDERFSLNFRSQDDRQASTPQEMSPADSVVSRKVVALGNKHYRADLVPVSRQNKSRGANAVLILCPKDPWWAMVAKAGWPSLASGGLAMLAGGLVAALLAGRLVRPIRAIEDQTKAIAAGRFDPIAVPQGDDEIADLAVSINSMARRLEQYEKEVRASERMRALARLGAGIAHQLRNSATAARMAIDLHHRECPADADCESLAVALRELELMDTYIGRFLELGTTRPQRRESVNLVQLVADVLKLVEPTCRHAGVKVARSGRVAETDAAVVIVEGDEQSLRQLIVNLVLNAVEAVERRDARSAERKPQKTEDTKIIVELKETDVAAVLSVLDAGPGPDAEISGRLFEPFITGKPDGTGLGLYVARQVAEAHHGSISYTRHDAMTCFCVEIPLQSLSPK